MKTLILFMIVLASVLPASGALAADASNRPAGVAEHNWILLSDRLGFVVVTPKDSTRIAPGALLAPPEAVSAEHMPPKKGYFVIRTPTGWQRLVISDP